MAWNDSKWAVYGTPLLAVYGTPLHWFRFRVRVTPPAPQKASVSSIDSSFFL
jgi:hypothetical protein